MSALNDDPADDDAPGHDPMTDRRSSPIQSARAYTDRLLMSRRRRLILGVVIAAVFLTATCALILGPARGARNDIAHVRGDLHASRTGIFATVTTLTQQLQTTEQSLVIQQQGLSVAKDS